MFTKDVLKPRLGARRDLYLGVVLLVKHHARAAHCRVSVSLQPSSENYFNFYFVCKGCGAEKLNSGSDSLVHGGGGAPLYYLAHDTHSLIYSCDSYVSGRVRLTIRPILAKVVSGLETEDRES